MVWSRASCPNVNRAAMMESEAGQPGRNHQLSASRSSMQETTAVATIPRQSIPTRVIDMPEYDTMEKQTKESGRMCPSAPVGSRPGGAGRGPFSQPAYQQQIARCLRFRRNNGKDRETDIVGSVHRRRIGQHRPLSRWLGIASLQHFCIPISASRKLLSLCLSCAQCWPSPRRTAT